MADLSGKVLRDRYRIIRRIGEGAMGEVYLAERAQGGGSSYAVKLLKRSLANEASLDRRFRDEGDVLRRLDHPGIVKVHDCFEENGTLFMVMAFVDGRSLAAVIDDGGAMAPEVALPLFEDVLAALDYAHRAGVIHRDIKPSNILIDRAGRPQLCDFGIARQVGRRGLTGAGMTLGTPHYMSPEQIQSPQSIDHRSDLYSAGIMLYEMLTGSVPFGNAPTDSDHAILQQQIQAEPPDPRTLNARLAPALCEVIAKALRKDPDRRFQGASDFRDALVQARSGAPPAVDRARRYAVYGLGEGEATAIKVGFSWPALCFGIAWMLAKGLFLQAACWAFGFAVFLAIGVAAVSASGLAGAFAWPVLVVLAAMWLLPALRGNLWLEDRLVRAGWNRLGDVSADSADAALERLFPRA